MTVFETIKQKLGLCFSNNPSFKQSRHRILESLESADNFDSLIQVLVEQQSKSRRSQLDIIEQMPPIAKRVEDALQKANDSLIKAVKESWLRLADDYLNELEAMQHPSEIYHKTSNLLTQMISWAKNGQAMAEQGVEQEEVDRLLETLDVITQDYEATHDVAEHAGKVGPDFIEPPKVDRIQQRFSSIYEPSKSKPVSISTVNEEHKLHDLKNQLYA